MNALGFIEITGVTAALDALDIMCKSANVELVTWERKLGGRLVTIIVEGDVSAVNAAVENANKLAIKKPVAHLVIANPHSETRRIVDMSAARIKNKNAAEKTADSKNKK
mgnify:CR=1 FL=1